MMLMEDMGTRRWTDEQWAAIERRRGDLLLDAAAGSGKTSVLVERFVRSVLEDGVEVGAILAITFTDKAAAELRDRIRARLEELGETEVARATEGAFISTIHGFCARVLRPHALAAGLDPEFRVLDAERSRAAALAAFDEALEEVGRLHPEAVELVAAHSAPSLRAAILSVYGRLRAAGELRPRLPEVPAVEVGPALARLHDAAAVLAAELSAIDAPGTRVVEAIARLERCSELREDAWPGELGRLRLPGGNGAALTTDACATYREALEHLRAVCAARAARPVRDLLDALLAAFGRRYEELKRRQSGVDFEDLELLTRALLQRDAGVRERYAERFERIMVDEFQDTNRVQLELIELVARGNLFTVGDAHQSIYGFRHAEVELFERRAQRLAEGGDRLTLQTNFRSAPEILAAVNHAFSTELGEGFRPLRAGRSAPPLADGEPRVEMLLVDKGAEWNLEGMASPWRLAEARALAERVAELIAGGAAPREVVVLLRAASDMRTYERALEARGLPTYVIGGRGYWDQPQVLDIVAYLFALANPREEESLYTVLSSPLAGVSLDALVVLAAAARREGLDPWSVLQSPGSALEALEPEDRGRLRAFAAWFEHVRQRARGGSLEELIDLALRDTGYDLAMLAMPGGRRRLANVRKLMRLAREFEAEHGPDLRGFTAALAERMTGSGLDPRESEAPLESEALDAIRLMTIHKAKGLEFPIVCVADLGRSPRPPSEMLRVGLDGRLGIRLARAGTGGREPALDFRALGEERQRAEEAEERRLFYVACTRARERLVLSGAAKLDGWVEPGPLGGGPVAWLAPALFGEMGPLVQGGGGVVALPGASVALRIAHPEEVGVEPAPAVGAPPAAVAAPVAAATPRPPSAPAAPVALSYSSLHDYTRCGYRFYFERVLGLRGEEPSAELEPTGRGAQERGLLLHALLERLDFRRPAPPAPEAARSAARRLGLREPTDAEAQELVKAVAAVAAGELCARLGAARTARREEHFAFLLAGELLVSGVFDVLAREPGGRLLVVDYKSDRLAGREPAELVRERYSIQQTVYALAALRTEGTSAVEVVHLFLQRPDAPVSASFQAGDDVELERRLEELAAGLRAGEYPVSPEPHLGLCRGCPAEGGPCSWPLSMTRRSAPDRLF